MRVYIRNDECYPVPEIVPAEKAKGEGYENPELPDELVAEYLVAKSKFNDLRIRMIKAIDESWERQNKP